MRRIVSKPAPGAAASKTSPPPPAGAKAKTPSSGSVKPAKSSGFSLDKLAQIKADRESRRTAMADAKQGARDKAKAYADAGIVGDIDFLEMIAEWKEKHPLVVEPFTPIPDMKMTVCIRKRPLNSKELKRQEHDCLTTANPYSIIHEPKTSVDQYKFLNHLAFKYDYAFGAEDPTESLYTAAVKPLVSFMLDGGYSTVFAYGQTGSGKTYTMNHCQALAVQDLFKAVEKMPAKQRVGVFVSCFEIYGPKCQDLLNNRERLEVMEGTNGAVEVVGLAKVPCSSAKELEACMAEANGLRTTSKTDANDTSSRSHSIMQITLHPPGDANAEQPLIGMMSVVDLAGSERGQDTKSHSRQLRTEGAEINKSLLALKECIRAMTKADAHVSFRASKLTQVLKASFTSKKAMTVMVAAVSPAAHSADHTINTLRYADRVKERGGKISLPIDHAKLQAGGDGEGGGGATLDMDDGDDEFQDGYEDNGDGGDGESDAGTNHEAEEQYAAVSEQLNEAEEHLLASHIGCVERNAVMCTEEGNLLASILDKDVVDYDIDEYADKLEASLLQRLSITHELQRRLADFRAKSRAEETVSRRMSTAKPRNNGGDW